MENSSLHIESESPAVWYVVRTHNRHEMEVSKFLEENHLPHFIPMTYQERCRLGETPRRVLVPVVHNLLFLQKTMPEKDLLHLLSACNVPLCVLKQEQNSLCYEIPDAQMNEFRVLCDPNFSGSEFITKEMAEARPGRRVVITQGQFKGIEGKLVRTNNNYFFIKTLFCVGVMFRISRWYCKVI